MVEKLSFFRTPIQFPVRDCIPCFLSSAKKVGGDTRVGTTWQGIRINHATKIDDLRKENNKGKINVYFRDYYFASDISAVEWTLGYLINVLGGKPPIDYEDLDDYLDKTVEVLNSLKGSNYFLKVRLEKYEENKLRLVRGLHPYISKEPDLSYREGEDEFHKHIINFKRYR